MNEDEDEHEGQEATTEEPEVDTSWDDRPRPPDEGRHRRSQPAGQRGFLPEHDPYWQFGTPIESWGSTTRGQGRDPRRDGAPRGPRSYWSCRTCGVKVERKGRHGRRATCPSCGRRMSEVRPG